MSSFVNYIGTEIEVTVDDTGLNIPVFTPSYWTQEVLETIASLPREERPDPVPSPPQPDWDGFLADFLTPGNPVYNATATKVQASSFYTQEHWANMRIGVTNSLIRNEQWLQACADFLVTLLEADNNPLTAEDKDNWVSLCSLHHITLVL